MSKVLFLNISGHGHVNPTLGLVEEFIKQEKEVVYFCSDEFKEKIEKTGAIFKSYGENAKVLKRNHKGNNESNDIDSLLIYINNILNSSEKFIDNILEQIKDFKFDYIVYGSMFPFGNIISQILKVPSVSSFAIFATKHEMKSIVLGEKAQELMGKHPVINTYKKVAVRLKETYGVEMPGIIDLFFNKGDLNIAYTSKYFVSNIEYYDESFIFIGPPIYDRKENVDFPFERLEGKKVIYISLGTVFANINYKLYDIFFEAFAETDAIVVMTAYNMDISKFHIPQNFIVKNYVPQSEILKYTDVAITHAGMNSTSDLLYNNVPFVAIPIRADQPYMASRASELGACISLDKDKLTPEILRTATLNVLTEPSYIENIKKISNSFKEAGGYKKAIEEIQKLEKK